MNLDQVKQLNIPKSPGVYQYFNGKGEIIYIGKAADLASRVLSYWPRARALERGKHKSADHTPAKAAMVSQVEKIKWIETGSEIEALLLEANMIKKHQPSFNVLLRDDKRFLYIKVSTEDEIPGVFATRKITKAGKYFGPFTSAAAVRETLKAIRKIWPYCNARKRQKKPCFYHQINLCAGICAGLISEKEYIDKIIKSIILFLEGKRSRIIKDYELQMKEYEKKLNELEKEELEIRNQELRKESVRQLADRNQESGSDKNKNAEKLENLRNKIAELRYVLLNMKRVLEHAEIINLADKYAADTVELAKLLNLPKVPERIEGYDISNIFGKEAVGSMVVFAGGEPDKSQYRKFKIRIGQGEANDTAMLREVLERRFKRSAVVLEKSEEAWPMPDLIIIDGGKQQVNAAVRILKKFKLDIPVIGISKGRGLRSAIAPDKLFFPGEKKPLELPLASPALHLIKRVRDEAHRFAVSYHRKLRKKEFFLKN